jgi:small subunit ribosomal protein S8
LEENAKVFHPQNEPLPPVRPVRRILSSFPVVPYLFQGTRLERRDPRHHEGELVKESKVMSLTDPIADMLTIVRNGSRAKHEKVDIPHSKMLASIAQILKEEGYIENFRVIKDQKQGLLRIYLRYVNKKSVIINLRRVSRSGGRVYSGGKGMAILTTSKGIMTDARARTEGVGGEVLCTIW